MAGLTIRTRRVVERMFSPERQQEVGELLETFCGNNLPFFGGYNGVELERVRFAVLKLSAGDVKQLVDAIAYAERDWRDAYVSAGFGDDIQAHDHWAEQLLVGE